MLPAHRIVFAVGKLAAKYLGLPELVGLRTIRPIRVP